MNGLIDSINKNRLIQIYEHSLDAIVYINEYQAIIYFNRSAEKLFGYTQEEIIGKHLNILIPPEYKKDHSSFVKGNQKNGENKVVGMNRDILIQTKRGKRKWVNISLSKIKIENSIEYVAFVRDINEIKLQQLNLQIISENLKQINRICRLGNWEWTPSTNELIWSEETYHLFGLDNQAFTPSVDAFFKLIHPEDLLQVYKIFKYPNKLLSLLDLEVRYLHSDSTYKYTSLRLVPVFENNELLKIVGINQDISERKALEFEIEERKGEFEILFNSVFEAVFIHDFQKILEVNNSFVNLFGYKKHEAINLGVLSLVPEEERSVVEHQYQITAVKPYQTIGMKKNGKYFPMEIYAKNVIYRGKEARVVGIRDLTELHNTEMNFRRNAELLKMASNIAIIGGWEYVPDSDSFHITKSLYQIFKINNGHILTRKFFYKYYGDESRRVLDEAINRALQNDESFDLELIIYVGSGVLKFIRQVGKIFVDHNGNKKLHGMIQDISEVKMAEHVQKQLQNRVDRLSDLEEVVSKSESVKELCKVIIDRLVEHAPYCNYFNFYVRHNNIPTKFVSTYVHGSDYENGKMHILDQDLIRGFERLTKDKEVTINNIEELEVLLPLEEHLLSIKVKSYVNIPLPDQDGKLIGFILIGANKPNMIRSKDLEYIYIAKDKVARTLKRHFLRSQIKEYNLQILEKNKELHVKNDELRIFSSAISHDMKTPLISMISMLDMILGENNMLPSTVRKELTMIRKSVSTMVENIEAVLKFGKVATGDQSFDDVDISELINQVKVALLISDKVKIKVPKELPVLKCNQSLMFKVFQNILSNAIKFNDKPQCVINIHYKLNQEGLHQFSIKDNGPGISSNFQRRAFELFSKSNHGKKDSSGVGLAIVKKIINIHKGDIWIDSMKGKGAKFVFTLPSWKSG